MDFFFDVWFLVPFFVSWFCFFAAAIIIIKEGQSPFEFRFFQKATYLTIAMIPSVTGFTVSYILKYIR